MIVIEMKQSYISVREVAQVDFFGFGAHSDVVDAGWWSDFQRIEKVVVVHSVATVR